MKSKHYFKGVGTKKKKKKRSGCSCFPFTLKCFFSPNRGPQRTDFSGPGELRCPGREGQVVLDFPPASAQQPSRTAGMRLPQSPLPGQGRFPAKTSAHPLIRFRLQMKYNRRAEMGKMGFFMRQCALCEWAAHKPWLASKSSAKSKELPHHRSLCTYFICLRKETRASILSRRNDTTVVNPFGLLCGSLALSCCTRRHCEGLDSDPESRGVSVLPAELL